MALTPIVYASFAGQTSGTLLKNYVPQSGDLNATFALLGHSGTNAALAFGSNNKPNSQVGNVDAFYRAGSTIASGQDQFDVSMDFDVTSLSMFIDTLGFTIGDDGTGNNFVDVLTWQGTAPATNGFHVTKHVGGTSTDIATPAFALTVGTIYTMTAQVRGSAGSYTLNLLCGPKGSTPTTVISGLSIPGTIIGNAVGPRQNFILSSGSGTAQTDTTGLHPLNFTLSSYAVSTALAEGAPTITTGSTPGSATVTAPTATGGTAPYSYQFQRAPVTSGTVGTYANLGTAGTSLTYADSGLTVGATYSYRIVVTDSASTPATATSAATSYTVPTPTFSLSTNPTSLNLGQGNSLMAVVTLSPTGGYTGTDTLSASGLPAGVTAGFSTGTIANGSGTATLSLTAAGNATLGTSTIMVSATDGTITSSTTMALTVTAPASGVTLDVVNNNILALINGVSAGAVRFTSTLH